MGDKNFLGKPPPIHHQPSQMARPDDRISSFITLDFLVLAFSPRLSSSSSSEISQLFFLFFIPLKTYTLWLHQRILTPSDTRNDSSGFTTKATRVFSFWTLIPRPCPASTRSYRNFLRQSFGQRIVELSDRLSENSVRATHCPIEQSFSVSVSVYFLTESHSRE